MTVDFVTTWEPHPYPHMAPTTCTLPAHHHHAQVHLVGLPEGTPCVECMAGQHSACMGWLCWCADAGCMAQRLNP